MEFKTKEQQGVIVISLKGRIMGGPDATLLNDQLHKLLDQKKKKVVIDLGGVKFMNSSGLGMLIAGLTTIRNGGGELKIASASTKIQSLLIVTKLMTVFEHYPTVKKALESFS